MLIWRLIFITSAKSKNIDDIIQNETSQQYYKLA